MNCLLGRNLRHHALLQFIQTAFRLFSPQIPDLGFGQLVQTLDYPPGQGCPLSETQFPNLGFQFYQAHVWLLLCRCLPQLYRNLSNATKNGTAL